MGKGAETLGKQPCAGKHIEMSRAEEYAIIPTGAPPHTGGEGLWKQVGTCQGH